MISTSLTFSSLLIVFLQGCNTEARALHPSPGWQGWVCRLEEMRAMLWMKSVTLQPHYPLGERRNLGVNHPHQQRCSRLTKSYIPVAMVERGVKLPAGVRNGG